MSKDAKKSAQIQFLYDLENASLSAGDSGMNLELICLQLDAACALKEELEALKEAAGG